MSIKLMKYVWENSQQAGSNLLMLLAIADHYNDGKGRAWPSIPTLASQTRMSHRQARRVIRHLADAGEITIQPRFRDTHYYRFPGWQSQGDTHDTLKSGEGDAHTPLRGTSRAGRGTSRAFEGGVHTPRSIIEPSSLTIIEPSSPAKPAKRRNGHRDDDDDLSSFFVEINANTSSKKKITAAADNYDIGELEALWKQAGRLTKTKDNPMGLFLTMLQTDQRAPAKPDRKSRYTSGKYANSIQT